MQLVISVLVMSLACLGSRSVRVDYSEEMGGPVGSLYDSPFLALRVGKNVLGFSANQRSFVIVSGSSVDDVLPNASYVGLGPSPDADALDHCGSWLNAAIALDDGTVAAFYHQEWKCNYTNNLFTNKSIGYAISADEGKTFTKPDHPNNAVIVPPAGNTTSAHQCGEGDHTVLRRGEYMYLYFREWDGYKGRATNGLARATVASKGVPGSWWKYHNGAFSQPGLGGQSSMISGVTGTAVYYRESSDDFISIGANLLLAFSQDGIAWEPLAAPLFYTDATSWNRKPPVTELVGYTALTGPLGHGDVSSSFWLYYTYLEPNATFAHRYLARRWVEIENNTAYPEVRVALTNYSHPKGDTWCTTAMVPQSAGYTRHGNVAHILTSSSATLGPVRALYGCYISMWKDHMVSIDRAECQAATFLRTLGWLFTKDIASLPTVELFRCFNRASKNHFVSASRVCDSRGSVEFSLGFALAR